MHEDEFEEDVGINIDFDQCSEEISFYSQCLKNAEHRKSGGDNLSLDSLSERADSAVCLHSAKNGFPAVLQNFNGSRKNHNIRTFPAENIKVAQEYQIEMNEQRKKSEGYLLTPQRLVTHILDFIDLPLRRKMKRRIDTDRVTEPLFFLNGHALDIHPDYFFPLESPYSNIQKSYLRSLVEKLTKYQKKLVEIHEFVEQISERSHLMLPLLITIFEQWAVEFLRDHSLKIDVLRGRRFIDPLQVLARLNDICQDIEVVRNVLDEDISKQVWLWEDIEKSWNRVFFTTEQNSLVNKREVIGKLQEKYIAALSATMDHIFENGRVPPNIGPFVFQNDARIDAELLHCRDLESFHSLLWDKQLVEIVLAAVKCRVRLGIIEFPSKTFSKLFDEIRKAENYSGSFLSFTEFRFIFKEACQCLYEQFGDEFIEKLHKNDSFVNLWTDLENVVIGSISQYYASTVFRSDSNVHNFSDAFWLACRGRMSNENLMHFSWIASKSEFSCKLNGLQASLIRPEIIDIMNQCMQFAHSAYRTRELLVTMANDKELLSKMTYPLSSLDVSKSSNGYEEMNRKLRKHLRFFVFSLEQIVSHFWELFVEKVRQVFRNKRDELEKAKSLKDVEMSVNNGYKQLAALVVRTGFRKTAHEAMDSFKIMTDEIRLRSVSNTLDLKYIVLCETQVQNTLNRLFNMAAAWGNDKDNLFFHLAVRLGSLKKSEQEI